MKNLWWISCLLYLFAAGCQPIRPDHLKRFSPVSTPNVIGYPIDSSALFKCSMEIGKRRLSGLMFIKNIDTSGIRTGGPKKYRVVFANEIGLTFFDFELTADSLKLISGLEALRNKSLLNLLKMDYQFITGITGSQVIKYFRKKPGGEIVLKGRQNGLIFWYQFNPGGDTVQIISGRKTWIDKVFIRYDLSNGSEAARIAIDHPVIGMRIKMRRLK